MDRDAFNKELESMSIPELLDCLSGIGDELAGREIYGVSQSVYAARSHLEDAFKGTWLRDAKAYPRTPPVEQPKVGQGEEGTA